MRVGGAPLRASSTLRGTTARRYAQGDPRAKSVELRLVVGPFADADAAAQLCAALAPFRVLCQPTTYDRQHLVLQ